MQISSELKQQFEAKFGPLPALPDRVAVPATDGFNLWTYLQACEQDLINLMNGQPPPETDTANIEYSWGLYFFNNDLQSTINAIGLGFAYNFLVSVLTDTYGPMPPSKITPAMWNTYLQVWQKQGALYGDGSLVSTAPYAVMDTNWTTALVYYYLSVYGIYNGPVNPFPTTPASVNLSTTTYPSLSVALFGDWGTGVYPDGNQPGSPAQMVGAQITAANPDVCIHLGDVYYAGTPPVKIGGVTISNGQEHDNFVTCWPMPGRSYNFTLNSNHEMYSGANGYFGVALSNAIFKTQQNTSYFQLQYGNWLIVGLDSAFFDRSYLFMNGAVTDSNQIAFLNKAGQYAKANNLSVIVLTHHTALNTSGTAQTTLYTQVVNALQQPQPNGTSLGVVPAYWYYGHVHNGAVYTSASAGGAVQCRCLGNAAIPIGNASWLSAAMQATPATVSFYTNKPLANPTPEQALRVQNGYAILNLTPTTIVENWYYQDGSLAWSSLP